MARIDFKRGDTFIIDAAVAQDGVPVDLTGYTVTAQIRAARTLIDDVIITWIDQAGGQFRLTVEDTTAWPLGGLVFDIEMTDAAGVIRSTETVYINCMEDITRG